MEELLEKILFQINQINQFKTTFTIEEAAAYMGIGHQKVRELVAMENTDFPYFKSGSKTRIDKKMLDMWIGKISIEHRVI